MMARYAGGRPGSSRRVRLGAGAAQRYGSPGGGADRAGTGAADGGSRRMMAVFLRCRGLRERELSVWLPSVCARCAAR